MVEVVDLVGNYAHGFMLDRSTYSSKVPKNLPPLNDLDIVLQALFINSIGMGYVPEGCSI
jgi:predicted Kef-type K+ transport protein